MTRLDVRKTHKLYIGGAFPRSESGRSYEVTDAKGGFLANASHASRKDARDAVLAARKAFGGWSTRTPYNRGQVIYRIAEVMEGRRDQFIAELREAEGAGRWSPACELPEHGFWFPPTLFTGVTQAHRIAREEIFGPVLSILTFRTPAEAVEKANNTPYGLSAGVWSDKGSRTLWVAGQLRAGVVWSNTFNRFDPASPFGGYKESGYGREGGRHGLEGYVR